MVDGNNPRDDSGKYGSSRRSFLQLAGVLTASGTLLSTSVTAQESDSDLEELVDEMTLSEKVYRTHGTDSPNWTLGVGGYLGGIERLGIRGIGMSGSSAGATLDVPSTAFPQPITQAATFNPELIAQGAAAQAREAKGGGVTVQLAPTMDMFRVPFHSRNLETYGEDPHLTTEMARAYTASVQDENVIATPKHFVAYNQTRTTGNVYDRFSTSEHNSVLDERTLREIYLPPFEAAVRDSDAGAIMPAYNRVNGTYSSEHYELLRDILKDEWEFDGVVISDWGGTHSTVRAAVNGLDVEMSSAEYFGETLQEAVENDELNVDVVDEMVRRGLQAQRDIDALTSEQEGLGDDSMIATEEHFELAEQTAEEGIVLLKNEDDELPLSTSSVSDLAVIGPTPEQFNLNIGGSTAREAAREIGPVEGIESAIEGDVNVTPVATDDLEYVSADGDGFSYEYYGNSDLEGEPTESGETETIDVEGAGRGEEPTFESARFEGTITPEESGVYGLGFTSGGQGFVYVDGERVAYNEPAGFAPTPERSSVELEAGTTYDVTVEIHGTAPAQLKWNPPSAYADAADAAADADVAVFLARTYTNYGDDRYQFPLPGDQNAAIESVAAANDRTVVLMNTGAPVAMPWSDDVPAIMQVWYPGQEAGTAVGNLLFGNANPSGKSPVTFAESHEDYLPGEVNTLPNEGRSYPGVSGNVYYDEGVFVGYRHFDAADIEPLFPFGHGLSYTDFEYSKVKVTPRSTTPDRGVTVEVEITNTGDRDGAETVQVYVGEVDPAVERPPKELKATAKPTIPAGETETVEMSLNRDAFRYWDPSEEDWMVDGGEYRILVGASSRDIRDETTVKVREKHRKKGSDRGADAKES